MAVLSFQANDDQVLFILMRGFVGAFETDQYDLPPIPLADIGDEVAEYTLDNLNEAIMKVNAEIERLRRCRDDHFQRRCGSPKELQTRLSFLRSERAVAREVYKRLGYGLIASTRAGTWMDSHQFRARPARYKTSYRRSIFVYTPTNYFTISPTVNMYGHSLGTDKIAHLFQQGYAYYRISARAEAKGLSRADAIKKAVEWGRLTEHTYYGTLVGGVFSNADLAANYAGMKFYEGLTRPIEIAGAERPAPLVLVNGIWTLNPISNPRQTLLLPFISDHMNEALNPSLYIPGLRSAIRRMVKKQSCPAWRTAFPDKGRAEFDQTTRSLTLWFGEDYGHKPSEKFVSIANTCFR